MIGVGIDWGERHHDGCLIDADGQRLARARIAESLDGVARLQELIGQHAAAPDQVVVGVECRSLRPIATRVFILFLPAVVRCSK